MCKMSETIDALAVALCKFQSEVGVVVKDATNPFFKSKYASLSEILDVIRDPLAKNGLAFTQFPTDEGGLTTILMHESGEYIMGTYRMTPADNKPQTLGSAITYQRRYALTAILGLNIDDDDDGNKASGKTDKEPSKNTDSDAKKKEFKTAWLADKDQMVKIFNSMGKYPDPKAKMKEVYLISDHTLNQVMEQYKDYKDGKHSDHN